MRNLPLVKELQRVIQINNEEKDNIKLQIKELKGKLSLINRKTAFYQKSLNYALKEEKLKEKKARRWRTDLFRTGPRTVGLVLRNHLDKWMSVHTIYEEVLILEGKDTSCLNAEDIVRVKRAIERDFKNLTKRGLVQSATSNGFTYYMLPDINQS